MKRSLIIGIIFGLVIFLLSLSFHVGGLKVASSQIGKPFEKPKPDLIVERVWLDLQCHIHFKIKNAGNGTISDADHGKGVVRVHYGREHEDFYFNRASSGGKPPVDSAGALKSPGGSVQYDTKIKLESPMSVVVHVDADHKVMESREENNRLSQSLTPQCPAISQATPAKPKKPSGEEPKKMVPKEGWLDKSREPFFKKDESENGIARDLGDRKAQTIEERKRKELWGKTVERRPIIIVDEPEEYTVWYAGCQYKIAWRSNVEMDFRIKFMFGGKVAWTFTPSALKFVKTGDYYFYSTSWTVPDNARWKEDTFPHIVIVESLDGKFYGKRDYLNIHACGLEIYSPPPRPERGSWAVGVRKGSNFDITWIYYGCTFRYFDIFLENISISGQEPRTIERGLEVRPYHGVPGKMCWQKFSWTVPEDLQEDYLYLIKVVGHRRDFGLHRRGDEITSFDIGGPITVRPPGY